MKKKSKIINNINKLIKTSGLKIKEVVARSGYTRDNVSRIRKGAIKLNQENMEKMATALNCYPSELLPLEWQKPGELDEKLLTEAIEDALDLLKEEERTPARLAHIILKRYKRRENKS